jgi:hypothetical protein
MPHLHDVHGPCGVVDEVADPIAPVLHPVHADGTSQLLEPAGPRLRRQVDGVLGKRHAHDAYRYAGPWANSRKFVTVTKPSRW